MWIFDSNYCTYKFDKYAQEFTEILNDYSKDYTNQEIAYEDALNHYLCEKSFYWKPNQDKFLCSVDLDHCFGLVHDLEGIHTGEDFICKCLRQCFKKCVRWED